MHGQPTFLNLAKLQSNNHSGGSEAMNWNLATPKKNVLNCITYAYLVRQVCLRVEVVVVERGQGRHPGDDGG